MPAESATDTLGGNELGRHERAEIDAPASPDTTGPSSAEALAPRRGRSTGAAVTFEELRARLGQPAGSLAPGTAAPRAGRRRAAETEHEVDGYPVIEADDLTRAAFAALVEALAEPASEIDDAHDDELEDTFEDDELEDDALDDAPGNEIAAADLPESPSDVAADGGSLEVDRARVAARPGRRGAYAGRRRAPTRARSVAGATLRPGGASTRPGDAARRRRRAARLLPIIAAMFLVLVTTGAATATRLAFASGTSTAAGADTVSTASQHNDTRVSRDKRDSTAPDALATGGASEPLPSPTATIVEPGQVPPLSVAGAGDANLAATPVPDPATETPTPAPPPAPVWVRPTIGGNLTSCFCTRWGTFHDGIDIDPPYGTPILAVGDGVVVYAGPLSGYGIGIFIRHDNGDVSFYGHENTAYVRTGDTVLAGQKIAFVASEGYSTGPHLHFGVYQGWVSASNHGTAIDPIPWLRDRGIEIGPYDPNG